MFNADSDGFEMHAQISLDAYDDHAWSLALDFTSCLDFARMEFIVPTGAHGGRKFTIDPDGFEMHAQVSWGARDVYAGCFALNFVW